VYRHFEPRYDLESAHHTSIDNAHEVTHANAAVECPDIQLCNASSILPSSLPDHPDPQLRVSLSVHIGIDGPDDSPSANLPGVHVTQEPSPGLPIKVGLTDVQKVRSEPADEPFVEDLEYGGGAASSKCK
jgi:hypothetical protein